MFNPGGYLAELRRSGRAPTLNGWQEMALLLAQQNKLDDAINCIRAAIEIEPKNLGSFSSNFSLFLNNRSWQLATDPDPKMRDPMRAVALAQEAVQLAPSSGSFWNTLGVTQYRAGDYKVAIESLEKSCALNSGGTAIDFFFLAMAKWQLENNVEARQLFEKGVEQIKEEQRNDPELIRFHAEAAELLGIEQLMPHKP